MELFKGKDKHIELILVKPKAGAQGTLEEELQKGKESAVRAAFSDGSLDGIGGRYDNHDMAANVTVIGKTTAEDTTWVRKRFFHADLPTACNFSITMGSGGQAVSELAQGELTPKELGKIFQDINDTAARVADIDETADGSLKITCDWSDGSEDNPFNVNLVVDNRGIASVSLKNDGSPNKLTILEDPRFDGITDPHSTYDLTNLQVAVNDRGFFTLTIPRREAME